MQRRDDSFRLVVTFARRSDIAIVTQSVRSPFCTPPWPLRTIRIRRLIDRAWWWRSTNDQANRILCARDTEPRIRAARPFGSRRLLLRASSRHHGLSSGDVGAKITSASPPPAIPPRMKPQMRLPAAHVGKAITGKASWEKRRACAYPVEARPALVHA